MLSTAETVASPLPTARERDAATVQSLSDALRSEARLITDLVQVMRRQRDAVASDDLEGVDTTIFDTHRVLLTLAEARRRRRSLNRILGESDDLSLAALESFFHGDPPTAVRSAAGQLGDAARALRLEVDMNRRILRHASESSERTMRALVAAPEIESAAYAADGSREDQSANGAIVDRRA